MTTRVINSSGADVRQDRRGVAFIGSTLEFVGFDKTASKTIATNLLLDAMRMVPALRQARVDKTWAGLRPMTPIICRSCAERPASQDYGSPPDIVERVCRMRRGQVRHSRI